jgi:hypothetical protein
MFPIDKAHELVKNHLDVYDVEPIAIKSALVTIDTQIEILELMYEYSIISNDVNIEALTFHLSWWKRVKDELLKVK